MQTEEQKENFGQAHKTDAMLHHHCIHGKCILLKGVKHGEIKGASYIFIFIFLRQKANPANAKNLGGILFF
jgi:hypothetical protein